MTDLPRCSASSAPTSSWTSPRPFDFVSRPAMYEAMVAATLPPGHELTTLALQEAGLRTAAAVAPRPAPQEPLLVRHPSAVDRVLQERRAAGHITSIPGMSQVVEKTIAYIPPIVYSHVTGIVSDTGDEAEGWRSTVGGAPKQMLAHPPEFTYSRLLEAAELSRRLGAQLMGLGAFTKVVGDAGVTVAKQAKLPVTTGNSYSASAPCGRRTRRSAGSGSPRSTTTAHCRGKAMVVGASGAIGSACARLLALASDELWLVSPETAKLLQIKQDIEPTHRAPSCTWATDPSAALADMDVIVTAPSAAGHKGRLTSCRSNRVA